MKKCKKMRAYLVAELIDGRICWGGGAQSFCTQAYIIIFQNNPLHAIYLIKSVTSIKHLLLIQLTGG